MKVKSTKGKIGDWVFVLICALISLICILPMLNLLARSLSGTDYLIRHEVYLWPKGLNFNAYSTVLSDPKYIRAFFFTVALTVVSTIVSLFMTTICAYPLIFPQLKGRGLFNILITITMFFNAGTIPNYLLISKTLHLSNTYLVYIIPTMFSCFNMIVIRTYIASLPEALVEYAPLRLPSVSQTSIQPSSLPIRSKA